MISLGHLLNYVIIIYMYVSNEGFHTVEVLCGFTNRLLDLYHRLFSDSFSLLRANVKAHMHQYNAVLLVCSNKETEHYCKNEAERSTHSLHLRLKMLSGKYWSRIMSLSI